MCVFFSSLDIVIPSFVILIVVQADSAILFQRFKIIINLVDNAKAPIQNRVWSLKFKNVSSENYREENYVM